MEAENYLPRWGDGISRNSTMFNGHARLDHFGYDDLLDAVEIIHDV